MIKFIKCLNCNIDRPWHRSNRNKYCSIQCKNDYEHKQRVEKWLVTGDTGYKSDKTPRFIIRYLTDTYGHKCDVCEITEWQNNPIVLELEHRDGNSKNNYLGNLCLICPNCHSQTETYKNRNKGNGRHARKQRYAEGKSF
jgi:hypothetical protein